MQNLVVVPRTVCSYVGGAKVLGSLGPRPIAMGAWLTLETCYSTYVLSYQIMSLYVKTVVFR